MSRGARKQKWPQKQSDRMTVLQPCRVLTMPRSGRAGASTPHGVVGEQQVLRLWHGDLAMLDRLGQKLGAIGLKLFHDFGGHVLVNDFPDLHWEIGRMAERLENVELESLKFAPDGWVARPPFAHFLPDRPSRAQGSRHQ